MRALVLLLAVLGLSIPASSISQGHLVQIPVASRKHTEDAVNRPGNNDDDLSRSQRSGPEVFNHHPKRSGNLRTLLEEFAAYIPRGKLLEIFLTYLQNDPDVQAAFEYLQGESFRKLVTNLEGLQDFKDFLDWLTTKNIDGHYVIDTVLDLLGVPEIERSRFIRVRDPKLKSGLINMINDFMDVLPLDMIADWFNSVCLPNSEFQELLDRLKSDSFKVVVNAVRNDPAFPEMVSELQKLEVDTDEIGDFLQKYLGR